MTPPHALHQINHHQPSLQIPRKVSIRYRHVEYTLWISCMHLESLKYPKNYTDISQAYQAGSKISSSPTPTESPKIVTSSSSGMKKISSVLKMPDISISQHSAEVSTAQLVWMTVAILFLVLAMATVISTVALGIIVYHMKNGAKSKSNSKLIIHQG